MTPVESIPILSSAGSNTLANPVTRTKGDEGFTQLVTDLLRETNDQHLEADQVLQTFATGETDSVQDVVLAMAKADMSFRFLLELRNQLIESYQEISRMQV